MGKFGGYYHGEQRKKKKKELEKKVQQLVNRSSFILPQIEIIKRGKK